MAKAKKPKAKAPFSNLGKDENGGTRSMLAKGQNNKRVDGKGLLAIAMGKMAKS